MGGIGNDFTYENTNKLVPLSRNNAECKIPKLIFFKKAITENLKAYIL